MPVATSDGQFYESEADYVLADAGIKNEVLPITGNKTLSAQMDVPALAKQIADYLRPQYTIEPPVRDLPSTPGKIPQNQLNAPEVALGAAMDLLSPIGGKAAAIGAKVAGEGISLGVIAGLASRTLNRDKLLEAQAMNLRGHTRDEIYNATGFFRGPDQRWRYEIPDLKPTDLDLPHTSNKAFLEPEFFKNKYGQDFAYLSQVVQHPDLFKAYPQLRNIEIHLDNSIPGYGEFHPARDGAAPLIRINTKNIAEYGKDVRETVFHEVQHAIQEIEQFGSRGSSQALVDTEIVNALLRRMQEATGKEKEEIVRAWDQYLADSDYLSYEAYRRNPGEVEARVVGRRALDEEQEVIPPYLDTDIGNLPTFQVNPKYLK